jgi:hypothetical protein
VSKFDSTLWMTIPAICNLASRRQWVCWKHATRNGKRTKIPYQPNGKPASPTNPQTWSEMPTCFTEVVAGRFDGLGYVLSPDDGVGCVDLDHCIRKDGTIEPWAAAIVEKLNSYTEVSPGGDGLHIWVIAHVAFSGRRHEGVEVYATGRYMTVTAQPWKDTPDKLEDRTAEIEKLVADFPAEPKPPVNNGGASIVIDPAAEPPGLKFGALLMNEPRFKRSWEHTRRDLGDQSLSSYDMSLTTIAAYAEWTDQELADLIIAHRRECGNPEKALRLDYLERTIRRARQATVVKLKDTEAAEIHRTGETREVGVREGLAELSTLLALDVRRVVQRGLDPAFYSIETTQGEIHIGGADILLSANKARAKLIAKSEIYIPKMKAKEWEKVVALIVQVHEYEDLAEGQRDTEISSWMSAYLVDHPPGEPEDSKALWVHIDTESWPFIWDKKIQVRVRELKSYIFRALGEKPSTAEICTRLRVSGWLPERIQVKQDQKLVQARAWTKEIDRCAEWI